MSLTTYRDSQPPAGAQFGRGPKLAKIQGFPRIFTVLDLHLDFSTRKGVVKIN